MAVASGATLNIRADEVPLFEGVLELARKNRSGGMTSNREHFAGDVDMGPDVPEPWQDLLFDPQTSGGLLIALDQLQADLALKVLTDAGVAAARIGSVAPPGARHLVVR